MCGGHFNRFLLDHRYILLYLLYTKTFLVVLYNFYYAYTWNIFIYFSSNSKLPETFFFFWLLGKHLSSLSSIKSFIIELWPRTMIDILLVGTYLVLYNDQRCWYQRAAYACIIMYNIIHPVFYYVSVGVNTTEICISIAVT